MNCTANIDPGFIARATESRESSSRKAVDKSGPSLSFRISRILNEMVLQYGSIPEAWSDVPEMIDMVSDDLVRVMAVLLEDFDYEGEKEYRSNQAVALRMLANTLIDLDYYQPKRL